MYQVQSLTTYSSRGLLIRWAIANLLAGLACSAATAFVAEPLINAINRAFGWTDGFEGLGGALLGMLLLVIVAGVVFGYVQHRVLARSLPGLGRWMLATALAVPISAILVAIFSVRIGSSLGMLLPGALVVVVQQLVLSPHSRRAGWWILTSGLAVGGALLLAGLFFALNLVIVAVTAAWGFYALVSGAALAWIVAPSFALRAPSSELTRSES